MNLFGFVSGYAIISVILFFLMALKCRKDPVFRAPDSRFWFYLLSFTWGLPTLLFGASVAAVLLIMGNKPQKFGWEWYFAFPGITWGLELGIFFIVPERCSEELMLHEHGHGIQNIYLGFFNLPVVTLPSAVRFWYRKWRFAAGKPCKTHYSDIWFEKSADESGRALMQKLDKKNLGKELCCDAGKENRTL